MNGFVNMNLTKEEGPNEDCLKPGAFNIIRKSEKESFDVTMLPEGRGFWWNPVRISV